MKICKIYKVRIKICIKYAINTHKIRKTRKDIPGYIPDDGGIMTYWFTIVHHSISKDIGLCMILTRNLGILVIQSLNSSHRLLSQIAATKRQCHAARQGFWQIQLKMEALAGDVMAGGAGAAGPVSDVRHQPAGDIYQQFDTGHTNTIL
jgi:hypothetical protein